jgi:hypothetical protein
MTTISRWQTVSTSFLLGLLCTGGLCAQQLAVSTAPNTAVSPAASARYNSSPDPGEATSSAIAGSPLESSSLQPTIDAPTPQTPQSDDSTGKQTTRILGIIPNFRAVSADQKLPPQSVKEKFVTASQDSFDYSSLVVPAALAGFDLGRNSIPEFGKGGVGYGRYLWHSTVDQTSENYWVEFIVPAVTHEDTRYYTLGRGGFLKRTEYALSRAVITRSDSGHEVFNAGEVIGAGASAGISNLYYPSSQRGFGNTGSQWGLDIAIDAATFEVKEFWPDLNHYLFHAQKP